MPNAGIVLKNHKQNFIAYFEHFFSQLVAYTAPFETDKRRQLLNAIHVIVWTWRRRVKLSRKED